MQRTSLGTIQSMFLILSSLGIESAQFLFSSHRLENLDLSPALQIFFSLENPHVPLSESLL